MRTLAALPPLLAMLAGCGLLPTAAATPDTITVTGTLTIRGGESANGLHGEECVMSGGYSDIRQGAQVVVTGGQGETIAVGRLIAGKLDRPEGTRYPSRRCVFGFAVDVPTGHDFYGLEVSGRGRLQYTAAQLRSPLKLELGGG